MRFFIIPLTPENIEMKEIILIEERPAVFTEFTKL
jgi:hypothetical protein